jgi:MscS family membrane protein
MNRKNLDYLKKESAYVKKEVRESIDKVKTLFRHKGLNRIIAFLSIFMIIIFSVLYLDNIKYINLPDVFVSTIFVLMKIVSFYLFASIFVRITINKILGFFKESFDLEYNLIMSKLYTFFVYLVVSIFLFVSLGLSIQNISIFLGLATTGFAFALRDILLSYFAWFILLSKKPFKIGDYIRIDGFEGKVMHIGTFFVVLDDSPDIMEDYTRVPNRIFLEKTVVNLGRNKIFMSHLFPLKKVPKDIKEKIYNIKKKFKEDKKKNINLFLMSDKDKFFLKVEYRSEYDFKDELYDYVIYLLTDELYDFIN